MIFGKPLNCTAIEWRSEHYTKRINERYSCCVYNWNVKQLLESKNCLREMRKVINILWYRQTVREHTIKTNFSPVVEILFHDFSSIPENLNLQMWKFQKSSIENDKSNVKGFLIQKELTVPLESMIYGFYFYFECRWSPHLWLSISHLTARLSKFRTLHWVYRNIHWYFQFCEKPNFEMLKISCITLFFKLFRSFLKGTKQKYIKTRL